MKTVRESVEMERLERAEGALVTVEGEAALPGGLREETRVLHAEAAVSMGRGELAGSRVLCDGRVAFHVVYAQGDFSVPASVETAADFSQPLTLPPGERGASALVVPRGAVQRVTAKAFNGRLLLKATVSVTADVLTRAPLLAVTGVPGVPDVRYASLSPALIVGRGAGRVLLREELELPASLEITDTLFGAASAQVSDLSGGEDGRALVSGTVSLCCWHASRLPGKPLTVTRHTVLFEQPVELTGELGDTMSADASVRDVAVISQDAGGEGRALRAEIDLHLAAAACRTRDAEVLSDAYLTDGGALSVDAADCVYVSGMTRAQASEPMKLTLHLPETAAPARAAVSAFAHPVLAGVERVGARVQVGGVMQASVIYLGTEGDALIGASFEEPFLVSLPLDAEPDDAISLTALDVEAQSAAPDRFELRLNLLARAEGVRQSTVTAARDVTATDAAAVRKGIALYYAQPGDTVWDVGKRYGLTLDALRALNPALTEAAPDTALTPGDVMVAVRR